MIRRLSAALFLAPATASAHYIPSTDVPTTVDVGMVTTWRSSSLINDYQYWQVPGTLMGGHAWPAEKGVEVDEMTLSLAHRLDQNLYGVVEVGSHAGDSDDHGGVELEHAYVGWVCCSDYGPWVAEVGRMSALFSPALAEHATQRLASEAPLTLDVLFGRHFHDDGARLWWHETGGISAGAEIWRGKAYPATDTSDGGAWDVFARYNWRGERLSWETGAWFYSAAAEARADHRYGGGHQHVPVAPPGETATAFSDIRFTGDSDIYGVHARVNYRLSQDITLALDGEWIHANLDGVLHDSIGRQADLDGDQSGGWIQPSLRWRRHTFGVRAEYLTTDNTVVGPAAPQLAEESGLANPDDHDPRRFTVIWHWQWRDNIALRAEAIRDESLTETDNRWTLGVIWRQRLWPGKTKSSHHHR
ncbi:hypothetical protein [Alcanivorax sp. 24]|uniref:hypothetical protein n=1 Tax=Alcanivorax sp. 24 TaxID=2545266 RepID=UPI00105DE1EE|nr:hypothetical protein [Alcanivorax sp. 24]